MPSNLFDLDYLYTSLTPSEEEIGDTEPAAAESRRKPLEKARDNGVRGHRRRPLTSALRCQRRHPPLPAATTGRRSARGLATLGARTGQYPHLEASVILFNKACCMRIAQLHRDNKATTSIFPSLFDRCWGAEASPTNLGYFTPWGPYSG